MGASRNPKKSQVAVLTEYLMEASGASSGESLRMYHKARHIRDAMRMINIWERLGKIKSHLAGTSVIAKVGGPGASEVYLHSARAGDVILREGKKK